MKEKYDILKLTYNEYVILFKCGSFYIAIDNDAIVMNKIFRYKLNRLTNFIKCGFPITSITKVINSLDNHNINYLVFDSDISKKKKFKNNNYSNYYVNLESFDIYNNRISKINSILVNNMSSSNINNILFEIENILCKIS